MGPLPVKVLVVDDSAYMRRVITAMLEKDPAIQVVGFARDGKDALEKIQRFKPDVITLDVEMPGMDGLETLQEIMGSNPLPDVMV
ncbi:MAG: response regulator, partial [Clostridia bacterium]|nr:response regulator [Clostridia bacterium]